MHAQSFMHILRTVGFLSGLAYCSRLLKISILNSTGSKFLWVKVLLYHLGLQISHHFLLEVHHVDFR